MRRGLEMNILRTLVVDLPAWAGLVMAAIKSVVV